jgi:hypothetical protein
MSSIGYVCFVSRCCQAMKLHRKLGKTIPSSDLPVNNQVDPSQTIVCDESIVKGTVCKPIGEEYIETIYDECRKPIVFHCKLCDCKFNDVNAKDAHLKGKRHRLSYRVNQRSYR